MRSALYLLLFLFIAGSCDTSTSLESSGSISVAEYFDYGETGVRMAGIRMIPIKTPAGEFNVWTKRFGKNPRIKILLLHGGPAATAEYMECYQSFFPQEGFEFYEYDQLGSYRSDKPTDSSLWTVDRFVEEVEQVRQAIGADQSNFYVLGNSWGGLLAMSYALKYQEHLKGMIVTNMMSSCPEYGKYAENVLAKQMDPEVLKEIRALEAKQDFSNPRYMELLLPNFYARHMCRLEEWPEPVNRSFNHLNHEIYTLMQGPSEFGISGRIANWDIRDRLKEIKIPTLTVGATFDTMDPEHMKWMSTEVQKGRYLHCPNGSHLAMWDDQEIFMEGVIRFIKDVDAGTF